MTDEQPFTFGAVAVPDDARVARVPPRIADKMELLLLLESELKLPGYFGRNWDALDEVLGASGWGEPWGVPLMAITHADLPDLGRRDSRIYLDILKKAIEERRRLRRAPLIVSFPDDARDAIEGLLRQN